MAQDLSEESDKGRDGAEIMDLSDLRRPRGGVACVAADPPWPYDDRLPGRGRGAAKHYDLMTVKDIGLLGLALRPKLADNVHLYLWTTNAFLPEAWQVARLWGFNPKTLLTWVKTRSGSSELPARELSGRLQIGMGHYFRNCTEHVVFAVRGRLPPAHRGLPTVFFAPRTQHSVKPDAAYEIFEAMTPPGPRLDMFARRRRPGWTAWGNGVER